MWKPYGIVRLPRPQWALIMLIVVSQKLDLGCELIFASSCKMY